MSEANQLIITSKKPDKYKEGTFSYFNFESVFTAWQELKPASFALYLYLLRDAPGFKRNLYKVDFEKLTGYKKTAYYDSLKELKAYGYLVQEEGTKWSFYPDKYSEKTDT